MIYSKKHHDYKMQMVEERKLEILRKDANIGIVKYIILAANLARIVNLAQIYIL